MRELYEAEFIGNIKIEDLDPIGYKVSFYTSRGSESPTVIMSDLQDEQFLDFIKQELRVLKLHKTKYFYLTKSYSNCEDNITPYTVNNNQYKTEVTAPPLFLYFKDKQMTIPYHNKGILIPIISNTYWDVLQQDTKDYHLEYDGNGSGYIKLIPKINYGKDKTYEITVVSKHKNIIATLTICQIGAREAFTSVKGTFYLVDGQEFLVLKDGLLE